MEEETALAGCSKIPSSKAAASESPRRYKPHFVWAVRPYNRSWRTEKPLQWFRYPSGSHWYVEGLNEVRTKLAAFFSILPLERPFSLQIAAKAAHQVGTKCPTFRFLHIRIGKMSANFLKAFFRLLIPLQPLRLL